MGRSAARRSICKTALIAWALALGASAATAQPGRTLTSNSLALVNGRLNIELEGAFREKFSVYGAVNGLVVEPVFGDSGGHVWGIGPEAGLRYFVLGTAPQGLFVGPFAEIAFLRDSGNSDIGYGFGAMAGFTFMPWSVLTVSAGAGFAYENFDVKLASNRAEGVSAVVPRLRLSVGVAF